MACSVKDFKKNVTITTYKSFAYSMRTVYL